ncbi:MAG: sugar phosphate isomerase/epimerase family protein [Cyclobacteriaceae bacterium]
MENQHYDRRSFLNTMALAGGALSSGLISPTESKAKSAMNLPEEDSMTIHVFSKHLQFLDYPEMAEVSAEVGFDGVDLAVRPRGHVLPENVKTDLPRAVKAIKDAGLTAKLMTTAIINAQESVNETVLKAASEQGIQYYRTNWLRYQDGDDVVTVIPEFQKKLAALAKLNEKYGMYGGYQNHAGVRYVGAPIWDIAYMLREIDHPNLGSQYDIRHATVEGGLAWPLGLQYIHPHINTLVIKDFRWEKIDGKWKVYNTPLGEGMVDFPAFFQKVKELQIQAPISLHFEYEMPEEDDSLSEAEKVKQTITVMQKDVNALRGYISDAGL